MNTSNLDHKSSLRGPSPTKKDWRPSTGFSPAKRSSKLNQSYLSNDEMMQTLGTSIFTYPGINIIRELTGKEIKQQDKDIEIERLKTTCFNLNNKSIVSDEMQKDIHVLNTRLAEAEQARSELENQNDSLHKEYQSKESQILQQCQSREDDMQKSCQEKLNQMQRECQQRETEMQRECQERENLMKRQCQERENTLSRKCENRENELHKLVQQLQNENSSLKNDIQSLLQDKAKLEQDLEAAADFNITMEEKVYKSNKISLDLINQLKIAEMELGFVYVPVRTDNIDCRLAEYINWSTARPALKSLFTRESEGVYQFGSKRCNVKWEINKLMVRVGGGYLKIDEFVEQYLPIELEKIGSKLGDYQANYTGTGASAFMGSVIKKSTSPAREASPRRNASPNTRHSTQIRQSVSFKYI